MSLIQARSWVRDSRRIVGFSGAGISTESGIPDFRSPNGVWANNRIVQFDEFVRNPADRIEYWRQKCLAWPDMRAAAPNGGHLAFVELHRQGKLTAMVTQNIDGLHQKAGLPAEVVHELHGTTLEAACLRCGDRISSDEACARVEAGELAPECRSCGGLLKPATISFGQPMPADVLRAAEKAASSCDLFVAVGSSLVVYPAAALPVVAKRSGAKLLILNRDPTPLDGVADAVLRGELGELLPELARAGA
ncbi:MAG: NAD-dependent deacetylase [Acidobacteria bacterium]|nr:NAD-dependent deacetylase [Acidobacteriota bacterium]